MKRANYGAVRPFVTAAVLASFAAVALGQVVESGRTFADLTSSHPCASGLTNRIARVTDCDAADDIGDGGGAFQCWALCDGTAPWETLAIGGGSGGSGDVVGPASATDNAIARYDLTTGKLLQNSAVTIADTTGDLQWEGTTADAFEGNFTFADPTADWTWAWDATGNVTGGNEFRLGGATSSFPMLKRSTGNVFFRLADDSAYTLIRSAGLDVFADETTRVLAIYGPSPFTVVGMASGVPFGWASSPTDGGTLDTILTRRSAGTVNFNSAFGSTPLAAPPHACDAAAEGEFYSDTSHAACFCDGSVWQKLTGAGTCS